VTRKTTTVVEQQAPALPVESRLAGFEGATGWLNSAPLDVEGLRGSVVLVDFWTYTCINWLRTSGYVRAWADKYVDGLVVVGVHTPEFPFERNVDNVRWAVGELGVTYPVALDNGYAVWDAFSNRYWPAVYIADADGRIRHHHFGEGGYDECERAIQQLLRAAGGDPGDDLVVVPEEGFQVQADWANLDTPETYVGYDQAQNFASPGGAERGHTRTYAAPASLPPSHWALTGGWTVGRGAAVSDLAGGAITFRFRARDVNLVMGPRATGSSVPFRVRLDGHAPHLAHGLDVDGDGRGAVTQQRLYQLIRRRGATGDSTIEISFPEGGVEAYAFTFG
jgi:thiol-disulfide isomerase/thioredoxin